MAPPEQLSSSRRLLAWYTHGVLCLSPVAAARRFTHFANCQAMPGHYQSRGAEGNASLSLTPHHSFGKARGGSMQRERPADPAAKRPF